MAKTNMGLVEYAKAQLGLPYWYGTFGNIGTVSLYQYKKKQYPSYYTSNDYVSQYGKRVHDCVGLIKGYLWSDTPTSEPKYNATQDVSANGMLSKCKENGPISTMPEVPGVLVFMNKHVGIYIGNGDVIEARGHAYGVVKTKLSGRPWTKWGKCPWIEYPATSTNKKEENLVLAFQKAATADGFKFPKYGCDGDYGAETEDVMKKCIIKKRSEYMYPNATKLVQRLLGVKADGKCGPNTDKVIKTFQKKNGLVADGAVGLNTWKKLLGIN